MMLKWTLALGILIAATQATAATELFVSPDGKDTNPGTKDAPFATLTRARDAVRALKAPQRCGGVTVTLREGTYRLTEPLALMKEDSGTKDAPMRYRGAEGETARIIGGAIIPPEAFKPVTDAAVLKRLGETVRDKVLVADLAAVGVKNLDPWNDRTRGGLGRPELFVNGKPIPFLKIGLQQASQVAE